MYIGFIEGVIGTLRQWRWRVSVCLARLCSARTRILRSDVDREVNTSLSRSASAHVPVPIHIYTHISQGYIKSY